MLLPCGKLLVLFLFSLLFLLSILFLKHKVVHKTFSRTELARPVMGTMFPSWASETSPTLGCSVEISRDIYILYILYIMSVCLVCQTRKMVPLRGERAHSLKLLCMYDKSFEISKTK